MFSDYAGVHFWAASGRILVLHWSSATRFEPVVTELHVTNPDRDTVTMLAHALACAGNPTGELIEHTAGGGMVSIGLASFVRRTVRPVSWTISVCQDCLHEHANGEHDPDRPTDLPEPLSAIPAGYSVCLGMDYSEHADDCTEETRAQDGCECENLGFRTTSCDGCGDWHHGDRYAMTLWKDNI